MSGQYWIEVGITRDVGDNTNLEGESLTYWGYYWARWAPGDKYREWRLGGDIGTSGTWHSYKIVWDAADDGYDVIVDGVVKATAFLNDLPVEYITTGLEALRCGAASDGQAHDGWQYKSSDGSWYDFVPDDTFAENAPAEIWRRLVSWPSYCDRMSTTDVC